MKNLKFTEKIVYFFNAISSAVLLLSYILPSIPPKSLSLFSVLSLGVPFLLLINVLFFLYWLVKVKKQLILSFVVLCIGYLCFGSLYKFSSSEVIEDDASFSIMNYNVRLFNLYEWIDEKHLETKIVDFISDMHPDILSLQEYHPHKNIDFSFYDYKYEKLSGGKTKYGQAIFSKFPIVNSGSIEFPNTSNNAIFVDIVKNEDTIRIYNIHLQSLRINADVESLKQENSERLLKRVSQTFEMQQFQAELFLLHKKQCQYKMVICGDFNNTAFSYVYKEIKGNLNDAFKTEGNGFGRTYDFKFFPVRIDFILTDESFNINSFKTFNEHYSDHYPILAKVNF